MRRPDYSRCRCSGCRGNPQREAANVTSAAAALYRTSPITRLYWPPHPVDRYAADRITDVVPDLGESLDLSGQLSAGAALLEVSDSRINRDVSDFSGVSWHMGVCRWVPAG